MARATTCKDAITKWEQVNGIPAAEAIDVQLQFRWPPIEKMDGALSSLTSCVKLSLSTNMIDKIAGIAGMKNLKILSLARNNIKSLSGIETVADSLQELWISYNNIDKLKGIGAMKRLRVLYMCNNLLKDWSELVRLQDCLELRDLVLLGNPIYDNQPDIETWRNVCSTKLQQIDKLDGIPIVREIV